MRDPTEIRQELDALMERRAALWKRLAAGHDAAVSAEIAQLTGRIEANWLELRRSSAHRRHGDPREIIARARAEARLDEILERWVETGDTRRRLRTSRAIAAPARGGR
jgi:hypothetical protein